MKTILTHKLEKYPHTATIFRDLGHRLVNVSDIRQVDKIKHFDGVLLLGGADVHPNLYGEDEDMCRFLDRDRDATEWYLTMTAIQMNKPVLGICRGMQLLNTVFGGTLYQDIYAEGIADENHANKHKIIAKSPAIFPRLKVNSRHHQAVKLLGEDFVSVAYAEDGIIEAIWKPGYMGVQWHPEDLYFQDKRWGDLFKFLIEGLKGE